MSLYEVIGIGVGVLVFLTLIAPLIWTAWTKR